MDKKNPWAFFRTFFSASHMQKYLKQRYKNLPDQEKLAFQNSYTIIYYIEHGKKYYDQSLIAPYELQPVLLFYGMVQLMKALILTVDPNYPETTQVLAHGVSTRKRKKSQYEFLFDEVKVQKNGLISYFSEKVFHMKQLEGEKYKMVDLLVQIPELQSTFKIMNKEKQSVPLCKKNENTFPELLVHYLILYNLSMICRYETEWWGELFHTYASNDLPFITEFLETTKQKVPYFISLLFEEPIF